MNAQTQLRSLTLSLMALISTLTPPISTAFAQGSLTPPGAPAPMFKTLQEIEPRMPISVIPTYLTAPGSYYLTTNLTQTNDVSAIVIGTNDITIDLNGFALVGTNGTAAGIESDGSIRKNVCIKNGTICNWRVGMSLFGGGDTLIDHVRVRGNTQNGISSYIAVTITDCHITENGFNGISIPGGSPSLIRDCVLSGNGLDCIQVFNNVVITGNLCTGPNSFASTNAGIRATGNNNRIDGNHVSFYGNGILVSASANLIMRNITCLTATNFAVSAGNLTGPTNDFTNPYANIAY